RALLERRRYLFGAHPDEVSEDDHLPLGERKPLDAKADLGIRDPPEGCVDRFLVEWLFLASLHRLGRLELDARPLSQRITDSVAGEPEEPRAEGPVGADLEAREPVQCLHEDLLGDVLSLVTVAQ